MLILTDLLASACLAVIHWWCAIIICCVHISMANKFREMNLIIRMRIKWEKVRSDELLKAWFIGHDQYFYSRFFFFLFSYSIFSIGWMSELVGIYLLPCWNSVQFSSLFLLSCDPNFISFCVNTHTYLTPHFTTTPCTKAKGCTTTYASKKRRMSKSLMLYKVVGDRSTFFSK